MDEQTKEKIIQFNKRFGLNTEFITDENILGYALGNTIYINSSIEQDYERTNRHELLHFFEETSEFEDIKMELFEAQRDNLEKLREEYKLKYFGLYSDEEIEAGVLDNEIAIDLMIDNSSIEYEEGLKIGERLLGSIEHGLEEKRYLNLSINRNIQNMNLSKWEKVFVADFYDGKEHILPQKDRANGIRQDIESYLNELYKLGEEEFKIDPHSPEIIREYESEIKALQARGENTEYLEINRERALQELATKYSQQLYAEYKHIVDLIKGKEYEPAFKCMMLRETLTKTYKLDTEKENGEENTNKTALKESLEKIRGTIAEYYECTEEEICLRDIDFEKTDIEVVPYKVIFGNADFYESQVQDLGQLQSIGGSALFSYSQVQDLGQLQCIGKEEWTEWGDRTDLKEQYEARKKEIEKRKLTGQDIGKAGFETSVEECDNASEFLNEQLAKTDERGDS